MKIRVPRIQLLIVALGAASVLAAPALAAPTSFKVAPTTGGSYTATATPPGAVYTGTAKLVVEKAVADLKTSGGTVNFTTGTFDLGIQYFLLGNIHDIVFAGAGIDKTIIKNSTDAVADTEPFNMHDAQRLTIQDLTVSAGGSPRTTSDAIDSDGGNDTVIQRVKIIASRSKGIIFDGKDKTRSADRNVIKDCVISGTTSDGIELLASRHNTVQGCTITNVGGHGIQLNKAPHVLTQIGQPDKKSSDNVVTGNTIDNAGQDGINVTSGDRNQITNNVITNSSNVTPRRDGIRVTSFESITCDDNVVSGNTATDNQPVKTQKYGLNIESVLCNRTVVGAGNQFTGNLTAPIHNLGTGTIFLGTSIPGPLPKPGTTFLPPGVSNVQSDIYSVRVDGTRLRRLTNAPAAVGYDSPAWSRNGRRIAFSGPSCATCPGAIFLILPGGGAQQQLPGTVPGALRPSWGRLDRSLTFVGGSTSSVYTISRLGSGQRQLTLGAVAHDQSAFSPDGRQIAFTTQQPNGRWDILVMRADGSHKRNLTRTVFSGGAAGLVARRGQDRVRPPVPREAGDLRDDHGRRSPADHLARGELPAAGVVARRPSDRLHQVDGDEIADHHHARRRHPPAPAANRHRLRPGGDVVAERPPNRLHRDPIGEVADPRLEQHVGSAVLGLHDAKRPHRCLCANRLEDDRADAFSSPTTPSPSNNGRPEMKTRVPRFLLLLVALGAVCVSAASALAAPTSFTVTAGAGSYTATPDTGAAYSGTVKVVVEKAVADLKAAGGTVNFTAGTFDLGLDSLVLGNLHDIVFAGAGMSLTTIMNSTAALADTEPFNMRNASRVTIRDMTISAGGRRARRATRSTPTAATTRSCYGSRSPRRVLAASSSTARISRAAPTET